MNYYTVDHQNLESLDSLIQLTLAMLKEMKEIDHSLLYSNLKDTYTLLAQESELALEPKHHQFYVREQVLSRLRHFLITIFKDSNSDVELKELALKTIALIATYRMSCEDLLVLYNLCAEDGSNYDLSQELSKISQLSEGNKLSDDKQDFGINTSNSCTTCLADFRQIPPANSFNSVLCYDTTSMFILNTASERLCRVNLKKTDAIEEGAVVNIQKIYELSIQSMVVIGNTIYCLTGPDSDCLLVAFNKNSLKQVKKKHMIEKSKEITEKNKGT